MDKSKRRASFLFFILTPFIPEVKTFLSCKKNFNVTAFGFSFIYWI